MNEVEDILSENKPVQKHPKSNMNFLMRFFRAVTYYIGKVGKFIWRLLRKYRFLLLIFLIIVVLITGYIGFSIASESQEPDNLLYYTLQLFVLQSGANVPVNPPLEIARFIAAFLAFYTVLFVIWVIIEHLQLFKLRLFRGHIVICGLGYLGPMIARKHIGKKPVVIIEKDPHNPDIQLWKDEGAIVLTGDAARKEILKKVHVERASDIFLVTGSDELNTEIAAKCMDIVEGRMPSLPENADYGIIEQFYRRMLRYLQHAWVVTATILGNVQKKLAFKMVRTGFISHIPNRDIQCHVHIVDRNLCDMLLSSNMMTDSHSRRFKIDFFNLYQIAGCCIIKKHPPFQPNKADIVKPHILVIGAGRMGESLIVRAAKKWKKFGRPDAKIQITCIDKEPGDKESTYTWKYPSLSRYCDLKMVKKNIYDLDFLNGDILTKIHASTPLTKVYICIDNVKVGMTAALTMARMPEFEQIEIIVRSTYVGDAMDIFEKFHKRAVNTGIFSNITSFPIVEDDCCITFLCGGLREMIARAGHKKYLEKRLLAGAKIGDEPSLEDWDNMSGDLRHSNLDQADHIYQKLSHIKFRIETRKNWDEQLYELNEEEIEILARIEHSRWCHERTNSGWIFGKPSQKKKKISEWMIPYDDLPEFMKDFDREPVRRITEYLELIDLKMVKEE